MERGFEGRSGLAIAVLINFGMIAGLLWDKSWNEIALIAGPVVLVTMLAWNGGYSTAARDVSVSTGIPLPD